MLVTLLVTALGKAGACARTDQEMQTPTLSALGEASQDHCASGSPLQHSGFVLGAVWSH